MMRIRIEHPCIYLGPDGAKTDCLLIEEGKIVSTGPDARLGSVDRVERPEGKCVMPGLIDSHIHLWGLGLRAGAVNLRGAKSTQEVYGRLAGARPVGGWILGKDWDQNIWSDGRELSRDVLDELFPATPVSLRRIDGHACWVNSEALRRAAISDSWKPPAGGDAWREGGISTGRLNGCLVDDAMKPIEAIMPPETEHDDLATYLESARLLRSFGITGAHKAWMPVDRLPMLERLRDSDRLGLRLHLLFDCNDANLKSLLERGPWADDWISARGIKYFADGAMGSRGAALLDKYKDGDHRGLVVETPETMNRDIPKYAALGWQIAVHAIGDRGAQNVLDAFERIPAELRATTRPRLEHAQMLDDRNLSRFGELGVIASLQPIHLHSDAAWIDQALSEEQLRRLFRWKELASSTRVSGGSDFPIEDPNPWHGISVAMTRRHAGGQVFHVEQCLTRTEAIALYTTDAAFAGFAENQIGRLETGFFADFCVLDTDPFLAPPEEIWNTNCLGTYLNGRLA
jgi:predicted amidohydrolase YtcJ